MGLVAMVALAAVAFASEPDSRSMALRPLSAHSLQIYKTRDGLPLNYVPTIAQDPRGFLWFGGAEGLTRFDGASFRTLNRQRLPELTSDNFTSVAVAPDGSLWLGTAGGGVQRLDHGRLVQTIAASELPNSEVSSLATQTDGSLWIATRGGLCYLDQTLRCFGESDGLPSTWIGEVVVGTAGSQEQVWAMVGGGLAIGSLGGFEHFELQNGEQVSCLAVDPQGVPWLGTDAGRAGPLREGRLEPLVDLGPEHGVSALAFDDAGAVWLGTQNSGLFRSAAGRVERLGVAEGLSNGRVLTLFFDREGFLWVGTFSGLARVADSLFSVYDRRHGLSHSTVVGVSARSEDLLVIADDGSIYRFDGLSLHLLANSELASGVRTLVERRGGELWGGGRNGLKRWSGSHFESAESPAGDESINALYESSDGCLWVGMTRHGVHRKCGGGEWESWGEGRGPDLNGVYTFAESPGRGLWVGGRDGLLWIPQEGEPRLYGAEDGLPDPLVVALHEDSEGILWLGTVNAGLVRFDGREFRAIAEDRGLPSNTVWSIVEDDRGFLWLSSNRGVTRASRDELNDLADDNRGRLTAIPFGPSEGLVDPDCVGGAVDAGTRMADGGIAFATAQGVAIVADPGAAGQSPPPPEVYLVETLVDGVAVASDSTLFLPPSTRRLDLGLGAPTTLSAHRVRLRYRLIGFEESWRDIGRERTVTFTNLAPGDYRFEVEASRDGQNWSPTSTTNLLVAARWYEVAWVRGLLLLAIPLGLLVVLRFRLREARRSEAALAEMVEERTEALRLANRELEGRNQQLADLTTLDPLTGLSNRRRLEEALDAEWRRCIRTGSELSLLMVDVDEFKAYNDSEGHPQGDRCLAGVAEVLREVSQRASDTVARYGGEEFAVLLPETPITVATQLAEAVRSGVEAASIPHPASAVGTVVTVSVGVCTLVPSLDHTGFSTLVEVADAALYRAKRQGRNRVVVAEDS